MPTMHSKEALLSWRASWVDLASAPSSVDGGRPRPFGTKGTLRAPTFLGNVPASPRQNYKSIWAQVRMLPASRAKKRKLGGGK